MKKLYTLLVVAFATLSSTAQIVNIPDANFKAKLLAANYVLSIASTQTPQYNSTNYNYTVTSYSKIDTNNDGEIQVSEALAIKWLKIDSSSISNLAGIEFFSNLVYLKCDYNLLTNLDLTGLTSLKYLNCKTNLLTNLNVSQCNSLKVLECFENQLTNLQLVNLTNLNYLGCAVNQITNLNVTGCVNLIEIYCNNNQITTIDLSTFTNLQLLDVSVNQLTSLDASSSLNLHSLTCGGNASLVYLNIKNGIINSNSNGWLGVEVNFNLTYICCDEGEINFVLSRLSDYALPNCQVNSYCSFVPGGTFYTIQGNTRFDTTNNGCDATDINIPNQKFNTTNGSITGTIISNNNGSYIIPVSSGTHIMTPMFENSSYFIVSPAIATVTFPATASPFTQNFCVTANGIKNDVEVTVLPIEVARPGFDAYYKIIYKNKGNQVSNGSLSFSFNDSKMDLISAIPVNISSTTNSLSWTYSNLNPFETREINLTFNINSPMETPAVNGGDILNYTAAIVGSTDFMPNDNTFTLNQTVVNSYDPNDKTCLEGTTITPSMVGQYVHYVIRFENTGTFAAQNVVVTDVIDTTKFDLASLVPQSSSHSFVTRINNATGKVEFIFENINLPFNDATNDGYVAFKIKTKSTLVLGNTFSNTANIYFDFNFPIVTNIATTTIAALSNQDFDFGSYFSVYPNPAKDVLHLATKNEIGVKAINIYNILGQMLLVVTNPENNVPIHVSNLKTGTYFIKVLTDKGTANTKFVKE
jgi:hypothetical protein